MGSKLVKNPFQKDVGLWAENGSEKRNQKYKKIKPRRLRQSLALATVGPRVPLGDYRG